MTILIFEFPFKGPWGDVMGAHLQELAGHIAAEDGLSWKIWLENPEAGIAGGIYLFSDAAKASAYKHRHLKRLADMGITDVSVRQMIANAALSRITHIELAGGRLVAG